MPTLLGLCLVASAIAAPRLEFSEVFPSPSNGIARHRIPGIVVTTQGTILAYCEARKNNSSDWGEIEVHLRRSVDGGRTWSVNKTLDAALSADSVAVLADSTVLCLYETRNDIRLARFNLEWLGVIP